MNIFICSDINCKPGLLTLIYSLLINNKDSTFNFYICCDDKNNFKHELNILKNKFSNFNNYEIVKFKNTSFFKNIINKIKKQNNAHRLENIFNHARLFMPWMFPCVKKALYLDCDILVVDDISKLYNLDTTKNVYGGIDPSCNPGTGNWGNRVRKKWDFKPDHKMINAGMYLYNVNHYRLKKYLNFLVKYYTNLIKQNKSIGNTQGLINRIFKDNLSYVSNIWNYTTWHRTTHCKHHCQHKHIKVGVKIIHYNAGEKPGPWYKNYKYNDCYTKEWNKYYNNLNNILY